MRGLIRDAGAGIAGAAMHALALPFVGGVVALLRGTCFPTPAGNAAGSAKGQAMNRNRSEFNAHAGLSAERVARVASRPAAAPRRGLSVVTVVRVLAFVFALACVAKAVL